MFWKREKPITQDSLTIKKFIFVTDNIYVRVRICDATVLEKQITKLSAELVSVIGRYYAMDRDQRWERIKQAYDLLVHSKGEKNQDIADAVQNSYEKGITDEFIKPICKVDADGHPIAKIEENDVSS